MTFVGGKIAKWSIYPNYIACCAIVLPLMNSLRKIDAHNLYVKLVYEKHQKCLFQTFFNAWQKESTKQLMKKMWMKKKKIWEKYQEQNILKTSDA